MNGNGISSLLPLPLFVKTPVNMSCSHSPPSAGSGFLSEDAQRAALGSPMVPTTWRAWSISTEVRSWPRNLQCHVGDCCYSRGPCKTQNNTSGHSPSGPSAFSGQKKDCHLPSTANTQPINAPFFPSYTIVIQLLLTHFTVLTSNLPAAATPDLIPPLSLSALTGLPFPSSVSAATALPHSLPWLTTPNPDKGHGKLHV